MNLNGDRIAAMTTSYAKLESMSDDRLAELQRAREIDLVRIGRVVTKRNNERHETGAS